MKDLRLAIGFLTVFPLAPGGELEMGPSRAFFPLVGLALGCVLAGLDFVVSQILPPQVVGALLVAALLVLTRAIHTEGFLDACDGLLGGYSPSERLRILRDTHVGAFGVIGGAALLMSKWALLASLPTEVRAGLLALFPCISRFGMLSTMAAFVYGREKGVGTAFQEEANWRQVAFGLATVLAAGGLFLGPAGLALLGAAVVVSLGLGRWITGMLGGMTGDTYGAVNEVAEVTVLALGIVLFNSMPSLYQPPFW